MASFLAIGSATLIKQDPGIGRAADGLPAASGETIVITEVPRPAQRSGANVSLRGIEPSGFALRDGFRITAGRRFRPGVLELIVGKGAVEQFAGLDIGNTLRFRGASWTIVGHFESGGAYDSELWSDRETVQGAFGRAGVSSVLAQLRSLDSFEAMKTRLTTDPQLDVDVRQKRDFFSGQSGNLTTIIGSLAGIVATIMAFGATFGALSTMYSAVSARTQEIKLDGQDAGEVHRGRKLSDSGAKARFFHEVAEAHLSKIIKVDLKSDLFTYDMDAAALARAQMMDGKLLLVSNVADLEPVAIVERYKSLADIERGFRVLKSEIEIAPVFHRLPERIRAQASICFMALILYRVMRQRLKAAGHAASPETALAQLRRIQRQSVSINQGTPISGISSINHEQAGLLAAMNLRRPAPEAQLTLL